MAGSFFENIKSIKEGLIDIIVAKMKNVFNKIIIYLDLFYEIQNIIMFTVFGSNLKFGVVLPVCYLSPFGALHDRISPPSTT